MGGLEVKKVSKLFTVFFISLFILVGCATEEVESFSLHALLDVHHEDEETPKIYIVNHEEAKDQVILLKNEWVSEFETKTIEERYDLENATVTEDEITIEYDGQVETFKRLSESVAENEDKFQYEYINTSEPVE